MTAVASLLGAAVLAFIAYKLLMGMMRVGVILLIIGALYALYSQGVIG
ncbi:MAG: hypothetical protein ACK554_06465 [Erythrobacteraceae bacterium]